MEEIHLNYDVPLEIWQIIIDDLNLTEQISFKTVCSRFKDLVVTNIYNISYKARKLLTDDSLKQLKGVRELNISFNEQITNEGLKHINPYKLNITNCSKITDIKHMTNLRELYASYKCGVDFDNIKELPSLNKIIATNNKKLISSPN